MVTPACEICQKRVEHDQEIVVLKVGSRNTGLLPGYLHQGNGVSIAHIDCVNVDHDEDYPEKTAHSLMERVDESEDDQ